MKYSKQIKTSVLTLMFLFLMLLTPIFLCLNMINVINGQSGPIAVPDVPIEMQSNGSMVQELWNQSWGSVITGYEFGIDIDDSDDVYITGSTASTDAFLAKYDSLGGQYWNTTWGGANDVRSTDVEWDGGSYIYLAGDTDVTDPGSVDAWIAKYDLDGNESWTDEWGVSSNTEYGNGIAVNGTTNAYLGGRRWAGGNAYQALLVTYDTAGNPGWSRNWGDTGAYTDLTSDVLIDGDYIIAGGRGESYSAGQFDAFLFKYNSSGDLQWDEVWGGAQMEILRDVDMDSSGNIYITGYTESFGPGTNAVFLVKYDTDGNQIWNRTWGDTGNDEAWGMYIDDSDYIYITGSTDGFGATNNDAFIIIYDTDGNLLWTNFWDGSGNDYGREIALDSTNSIYMVGYTDSYGGGDQGFLLKCRNDYVTTLESIQYTKAWNATWGDAENNLGVEVEVDGSGNAYIIGQTYNTSISAYQAYLAKFDANGNEVWNYTLGRGFRPYKDPPHQDLAWDGGNYIYLTWTWDTGTDLQLYYAKYDLDGNEVWTKSWGVGGNSEYAQGVMTNGTSNFYVVGSYWGGGGKFDLIFKNYDTDGNEDWSRGWGAGEYDWACDLVKGTDEYLYIVGYTASYGAGGADILLLKYNTSGDQEWYKTWGGVNFELGYDIAIDDSDNLYLVGYTESFGAGQRDAVIIKYDSDGNEIWNQTWGGTGFDEGKGITIDGNSNLIMTGSTSQFGAGENDTFYAIYNTDGDLLLNGTWGGSNNEYGEGIAYDGSNLYLTGFTESFGVGQEDAFLVKLGVHIESNRTVTLTETAGVDRTNEPVTISMDDLAPGTCYYDSPRVYQPDSSGTEIPSQVWNGVYDTVDTDHNFMSSTDWAQPTGWSVETLGDGAIRVLPHYAGHQKVCELIDTSNPASMADIYESFSAQTAGTLEAWVRTSDAANGNAIVFRNGGTYALEVGIIGNLWQYYDTIWNPLEAASSDTWYHVKIDFDCVTDTYNLTINGGTPHTGLGFMNNVASVNMLRFETVSTGDFSMYVDAVDYSWETGYSDGRNKFLTSFDVSFLANVSASSSKDYTIYYASTSHGDPGYAGLSRNAGQVTCSDGTQYNFAASTDRYFMTTTQLDKNGVDWALDTAESLEFGGHWFEAPVSPLWLETGIVLAEVAYRYNSTQYTHYRIHDNAMIRMTHMYSEDTYDLYYHGYDDPIFVEHLRYYKSGWQQLAVGTGNNYNSCTEGKWFFDDTDDKQVIFSTVWDLTNETDGFLFSTTDASRCVMQLGRPELTTYEFLANKEYTFWIGFQDVGSTGQSAKESYVDDLYTVLITDPLIPLAQAGYSFESNQTVTLTETAGVDRTNEPVTVSIEDLVPGECYYDSPRVYQPDSSGAEIPSQVWNATYNSHDADYNFLSSADWQTGSPTGWSSLIDSGCAITALPYYTGHRKVVQIDDQSGTGGVNLYENIGSQVSGTVAFWYRTSDSSKGASFSVKDNAYNGFAAVGLHEKLGKWVFYDTGGEKDVVDATLSSVSCANDNWYHVKFTFFCSNDTYKLWINGTQAYWNDASTPNPDFGFATAGLTNVDYMVVTTYSADSAYQIYFDAFTFSWGSGYAEDMEKFLTSFDASFLVNVSASSSKDYTVYYASTSQGDPGYSGLSQSAGQVTCSDGTQYNFAASTNRYFMTTTQLDKNGVDWALDATESLMFGELFGAAVSSLWLESSTIFAEVAYRYNSTQYMHYRIHDNAMVRMVHMYSGYNFFDYYYHGYDDPTFAEHLRYYKSGWQQMAAGSGVSYDACTEGKWFFDDTDDKQVILATVWNLTSETDDFSFSSDQADRFIMQHGRIGPATFDFLVDTEYTFWFGFQDAGSTGQAAKESYVDDLYTALISDPLVQINETTLQWNTTWGGADLDRAERIAVDGSGNVYVSGQLYSQGDGKYYSFLSKHDSAGNEIDNVTLHENFVDQVQGIAWDGADNIYLSDTEHETLFPTRGDAFIGKYNLDLTENWTDSWGLSDNGDLDYGIAINGTSDIYVVGRSYSVATATRLLVMKYDPAGSRDWLRTWDCPGFFTDIAYSAVVDGDYIYIAGFTYGAGYECDLLLMKYNSSGDVEWWRNWVGGSGYDFGYDIAMDSAHNIYVAGVTGEAGTGDADALIVKYDSGGNEIWNKTWGGTGYDQARGIEIDSTDQIYIVGTTDSLGAGKNDTFLAVFDVLGNELYNTTWGGSEDDLGMDLVLDGDTNLYVTGTTASFGAGQEDMFILKYSVSGGAPVETSIDAPINLQADPSGYTSVNSFNVSWTNPSDPSGIVGAYYKLDSPPTADDNGTYVVGADIQEITGITVSGDGVHPIYVWLKDGVGNIDYQINNSTTLYLDTSIQGPNDLLPIPSIWTNVNSFDISWNNPVDPDGIVGAYYKLDIAPTFDTDGVYVAGADIEQILGIAVSGYGQHPIYVWLEDGLGNINYMLRNSTNLNYDANIGTPSGLLSDPISWNTINNFNVSWTNPAEHSGIVGAYYKYDTAPTFDTDGTFFAGSDLTELILSDVPSDGTHNLYVWLRDSAGNIDFNNRSSTTLYLDTSILAPISLGASPYNWTYNNSFNLTWSNPTEDSGIIGAYYKVGLAPSFATDGTYTAGIGINYTLGIIVPSNGTHQVHVWLVDAAGNNGFTNYASTTLYLDQIPPTPPPSVSASVKGNKVTISWTLSIEGDIDHYNIYRSRSPIINVSGLTPIAITVDNTTNSYEDRKLSPGTYFYVVTAVDLAGQESVISIITAATVPGGPDPRIIIIIIIICIVGAVAGIGTTSTIIIYRRRSAAPPKKKLPPTPKKERKAPKAREIPEDEQVLTELRSQDLINQLKASYSNRIFTIYELDEEKLKIHEILAQTELSDAEKKQFIDEIFSLPKEEQEALFNNMDIITNEQELMISLDESLKRAEDLEKEKKIGPAIEEYYKILSIAEGLGDDNLFQKILQKIEGLESQHN